MICLYWFDLGNLPSFLPAPKPCPFVSPWEVYKALSKIREKTSGGPDGISARIVRLFSVELATPLSLIINSSFKQGKVPCQWKRAIVVPVPKSSPPSIDQLRPISLTDHFAKVAEGFIASWTLQDLIPKLDPNQFGNRKSLSTSHCLINILHRLFENAEKPKSSSTVVLTDFKKAFDRVDHSIAVTKLINLGVRRTIIPWICDFLTARKQCVRYRGVLSNWTEVCAGIPQGTRLGPIIFLAMVNDACPHDQLHSFKYVDDLTLVECRNQNQVSVLQTALDNLSHWSETNKMKLNPVKCMKLEVSFTRGPPVNIPLTVDNVAIESVNEAKILGVNLQSDLKWESHVRYIEKRTNSKLYMLRTLRSHGLPHHDLLTIFVAFVRPILEYAAPVWSSGLTLDQRSRLERLQKRALRIIFRGQYTDYEDILSRSKLSSLEDRRRELCLQFFKNTLSCTSQFSNFFQKRESNRSLRKSTKIPEFKCKTKRMQCSPLPYLVHLYNLS